MSITKRLACALVLLTAVSGCASAAKQTKLEHVAKDWSMVLRASQIIPVYPLTEDLQPGDIFLVQMPIDKQQELYEEQGFLPLDNMVSRVYPTGYEAFYKRLGVGGDKKPVPGVWLKDWDGAPSAGFPTYSISAKSGGAFNLALPVQGVPVGLALLGGDAADVTVTIAKASGYGVDMVSLHNDVVEWATQSQNRELLSNYGPAADRQNYIRVVSRVYLVHELIVGIRSAGSFGASASGGAPKPLDSSVPVTDSDPRKATADTYKANIEALNKTIPELPGGTVRVVSATASSISLENKFPRPLVIGYLGFDMAIDANGILGPPIPTHAILLKQVDPKSVTSSAQLLSNASLNFAYALLVESKKAGDTEAAALVQDLDKLGTAVPEKFPCAVFKFTDANSPLEEERKSGDATGRDSRGFQAVTTYQGKLLSSIDALKKTMGDPSRQVKGFKTKSDAEAYLKQQLACNEDALRGLRLALKPHNLLFKHAYDFAGGVEAAR